MHKVFGEKIKTNYKDRRGAYLIPISDGKVAVVKNPKGFFFLGGGLETDEKEEECIVRECMEEVGYTVTVGEKICSAEAYMYHTKIGYFHPIQTYYAGKVGSRVECPVEKDHTIMWLNYCDLKGKMYLEMQNWALEYCWNEMHRQ